MQKITKIALPLILFALTIAAIGAVATTRAGMAATSAGPLLSIETEIPAEPNDSVNVPVQFTSNGNSVASMAFSIDYDQTWLDVDWDPTNAPTITFNLPSTFVGSCSVDKTDTDGEIDCFVLDPMAPLATIPDSQFLTLRFLTLDAPNGTVAAVAFSTSPAASFGDTAGQSVSGSSQDGSVLIGEGLKSGKIFLPVMIKDHTPTPAPTATPTNTPESPVASATPTPTSTATLIPGAPTNTPTNTPVVEPGCTDLIVNSGFEDDRAWVFEDTVFPASYSTERPRSGERALLTGIIDIDDRVESWSTGYQTVVIPSDAVSAILKFWDYPISGEATTQWNPSFYWYYIIGSLPLALTETDAQYVIIKDITANGALNIVFWQLSNSQKWEYNAIDLTNYKGHEIQVRFTSVNDDYNGITAMYVDDVYLEVCK